MSKLNITLMFLFTILGILIGFVTFSILDVKNKYDGYWTSNINKTELDSFLKSADARGTWVSVNINGMSFERAYEVCRHEVGHEIFAETCEKDLDTCLKIAKELEGDD